MRGAMKDTAAIATQGRMSSADIGTNQCSYGTDLGPVKRKRLNTVAICLNLFLPSTIFCLLYGIMCFSIHYTRPHLTYGCVAFGLALALGAGFMAYRAKYRDYDMMWYSFSALSIFLAVALATIFGDLNYTYNLEPYYDMDNLNTYNYVNVAEKKGKEMMDAGRVWFAEDVQLDTRKAIGFKNDHIYCVAPITYGDHQLASYDFWAIGVDCCDGSSGDFRCGQYDNYHARAGLRLMRADQRPFFRLAVEMAESASNIKAMHPLFFYWLQDPIKEMNKYRDDGFRYFVIGIFCHFIFNTFWVVLSTIGFQRIGPYRYGFGFY